MTSSDPDLELSSGIKAFEAKDFTSAMRLLSPLADGGNAEAQYKVGEMYEMGRGVDQDREKARDALDRVRGPGRAGFDYGRPEPERGGPFP